MEEGNENLDYPFPWDFKRCLTYRKFVGHRTSGFTFHSKEGVLQVFIALKNPSPWPRSNLRPLGPVVLYQANQPFFYLLNGFAKLGTTHLSTRRETLSTYVVIV
jgi:hypothetical protein